MSDKQYGFIKISTNWADEMDIEGFLVCDPEVWNEKLKKIQAFLDKQNAVVCVGTNEELEFENYRDFIRICDIKVISEPEAALLAKLFAHDKNDRDFTYAFGNIPDAILEYAVDFSDDEDEDIDLEDD